MDPFLAEVRIMGFNFAPRGWAQCNGQLMPISQNTALFSLVGTTYGGDGRVTFGLPNLQGSVPMHPGVGAGLTPRELGEIGGSETAAVDVSQIPMHTHTVRAASFPGDVQAPTSATALSRAHGGNAYQSNPSQNPVTMAPEALTPAGGSQPHNNMQPYLTLNFCIALQGVFPARN
jgi:microcystin-dependent protein